MSESVIYSREGMEVRVGYSTNREIRLHVWGQRDTPMYGYYGGTTGYTDPHPIFRWWGRLSVEDAVREAVRMAEAQHAAYRQRLDLEARAAATATVELELGRIVSALEHEAPT